MQEKENSGPQAKFIAVFIEGSGLYRLEEELAQDRFGVLRAGDSVSNDAGVLEDLIIVAALERLITKEVNMLEVLVLNVAKAVSLVPSHREDIKGDLASYSVITVIMKTNIS